MLVQQRQHRGNTGEYPHAPFGAQGPRTRITLRHEISKQSSAGYGIRMGCMHVLGFAWDSFSFFSLLFNEVAIQVHPSFTLAPRLGDQAENAFMMLVLMVNSSTLSALMLPPSSILVSLATSLVPHSEPPFLFHTLAILAYRLAALASPPMCGNRRKKKTHKHKNNPLST